MGTAAGRPGTEQEASNTMTWLKIGQRIINLDRATCIEDIPAIRGSGKGRRKSSGNGRGGGIRVVFGKDNHVDFADEGVNHRDRVVPRSDGEPAPDQVTRGALDSSFQDLL